MKLLIDFPELAELACEAINKPLNLTLSCVDNKTVKVAMTNDNELNRSKMKKLIMLIIAFITLIGCRGNHQQEENTSEWGDSIATINNTAYYWLQLADDSARISVVRDNELVTECIVRGQVYGARQYDDGEIYILCGQNQIYWFDVRYIPSEIDLMTEEEWDNYDPSQENADAIIDIDM